MLQFARGVAFGVDVGDFLELEGAFERDRVVHAAAEIEHVARLRELVGDGFDLRLSGERIGDESRRFHERANEASFFL